MTTEEEATLIRHVAENALNADNAVDYIASAAYVIPHLAVVDGVVVPIDAHGAPRIKADLITCKDRNWTMQELLNDLRYWANGRFNYRANAT